MLYILSRILKKAFGWKFIYNIDPSIKKFVVLGAPHTSNWDGIWALAYVSYFKIPFKFLIKKDLFFFPLGIILRKLGGLPVDRSKSNSLTDQCVEYFKQNETLVLGITPEGTRSYNDQWKKGFYYISEKANIPIVVGYIDYEKKIVSMDHILKKTGNIDLDIQTLKAFYKTKKGKHPEKGVI